MVTHDISVVERLCDEAVWLQAGYVAASGDARRIAREYAAHMEEETVRRTPGRSVFPGDVIPRERTGQPELIVGENRFGSFDASIDNVHIYGESGTSADEMITGQKLVVELEYSIAKRSGVPDLRHNHPSPGWEGVLRREHGRRRSRIAGAYQTGASCGRNLRSGSGSGHLLY